jgi:hypothetical protein
MLAGRDVPWLHDGLGPVLSKQRICTRVGFE